MKSLWLASLTAVCCSAALATVTVRGQSGDTVEAHVAAAKAAYGADQIGPFNLCNPPAPAGGQRGRGGAPAGPPDRARWHADPVKVFDNLYFVGQTEYSSWAVTTSAGIIIVDAIWDYSVEDEVAGGLKTLGLNPADIKYVLVSHGHIDHAGGAKYLQDTFGARVIMSAADWDLIAANNQAWPKPRRDIVATDGQKLTLGDTTLTMYLTPGHTPVTISTLSPVKDRGVPHMVAEWGGTGFNFTLSPDRPQRYWFETYIKSAEHFRDAATKAGADALIANHTNLDGSTKKLPMLASRKAGDPNPYVIGKDGVRRYLTVAYECAKAGLGRL